MQNEVNEHKQNWINRLGKVTKERIKETDFGLWFSRRGKDEKTV